MQQSIGRHLYKPSYDSVFLLKKPAPGGDWEEKAIPLGLLHCDRCPFYRLQRSFGLCWIPLRSQIVAPGSRRRRFGWARLAEAVVGGIMEAAVVIAWFKFFTKVAILWQ